MSIKLNGQDCKVYKGDHKPVNLYRGIKKIAGWKEEQQTGEGPLVFERTYDDEVQVTVEGETEQLLMPDKSIVLDGSSSVINCGRGLVYFATGISLEFDVKLTADVEYKYLIYRTNSFRIFYNYGGTPKFYVFISGVGGNYFGETPLSIDEWHRVSITFGAIYARIYVDSILKGSIALTGSFPLDISGCDSDMLIGGRNTSESWYGNIANVSIWDKELSQQEIADNFQKRLVGTESNLVGYWYLNEGQGAVAKDLAGGNDGILIDAAWSDDAPLMINDIINPDYPSEVKSVEGASVKVKGTDESQQMTIQLPALRKIGYVADTYNSMTGEYVQRIGKYVITGTENWQQNSGIHISHAYVGPIPNYLSSTLNAYCTHFKNSNRYNTAGVIYAGIGFHLVPSLVDEAFCATAEEFKQWLVGQYAKGTPATVYYQLAEPITTYLDPATVPTFPGTTVIEQDGEVKGMITATVKVMEVEE
jgi:hypothetical protein